MADTTKLEAVHSQRIRCLGPKEQDIDRLLERLRRGRRPANRLAASAQARREAELAVREAVNTIRAGEGENETVTTADMIAFLFRAGKLGTATVVKAYANLGCGYDLRELIALFPRDGQLRVKPCPRCERAVRFRTPSVPHPDQAEQLAADG